MTEEKKPDGDGQKIGLGLGLVALLVVFFWLGAGGSFDGVGRFLGSVAGYFAIFFGALHRCGFRHASHDPHL